MEVDDLADACARCGVLQTAAINMTIDSMQFKVNAHPRCGHRFCGNCLQEVFVNQGKRQFQCNKCKNMVTQDKLTDKTLDETEVEKDARVRKRVKKIYNKTQDVFPTLKAYKDYEEEVEDTIFSLVHNIDVDATNKKIKAYKDKNELQIIADKTKAEADKRTLDKRIAEQARSKHQAEQLQLKQDSEKRERKRELRKQENEVALGERDEVNLNDTSNASRYNGGFDGGSASGAQKAVYLDQAHFVALGKLSQRLLPQVRHQPPRRQLTRKERQRSCAAGGYEHLDWFKKSWQELVTNPCIPKQSKW